MANNIDTLRAIFTYLIALVIVAGGGAMLFATRADTGSGDLRVIIAGFMGSAITFAFQQETQTRTARQTNTAQAAGAVTHANGISGTTPPAG